MRTHKPQSEVWPHAVLALQQGKGLGMIYLDFYYYEEDKVWDTAHNG